MTARQQVRPHLPRFPLASSLIVAAFALAGCALAAGTLAACAAPDGYPPVARIAFQPGAIPENDGFQTTVTLDAAMSADPIDDPEGAHALSYRWEIVGDEYRVQEGSLGSAAITLTLLGERPATILLTVTDRDGQSSTAREQLQLTLAP